MSGWQFRARDNRSLSRGRVRRQI